jgi:hypothetical protein
MGFGDEGAVCRLGRLQRYLIIWVPKSGDFGIYCLYCHLRNVAHALYDSKSYDIVFVVVYNDNEHHTKISFRYGEEKRLRSGTSYVGIVTFREKRKENRNT